MIPCEECIVLAICKGKYSSPSKTIIECEDLWNYVVEETAQPNEVDDWLKSASRQVRSKRIEEVQKMFPNVRDLKWGDDLL